MKKKLFLPLFVIFTAFFTNQSFAGSGLMSINGQDTKAAGTKTPSVSETLDLLFQGKQISGLKHYTACDANCYANNIATFTKVGREGVYKNLDVINTKLNGLLLKSSGSIAKFDESRRLNAEKLLRENGTVMNINFGSTNGKLLGVKNDLSGASGFIDRNDLSGDYLVLDLTKHAQGQYIIAKLDCANPVHPDLVFALETGKQQQQANSGTKTDADDADPNLKAVLDNQQKNNGNNTKEVITTPDGKTTIVLNINANPVAYAGGSNATAYVTGTTATAGGSGTATPAKYQPSTQVQDYQYFGPRESYNTTTAQCGNCPRACGNCNRTSCGGGCSQQRQGGNDGYQNTGGNVYVQTYPTNRNGRPKSDPASIANALFNGINAGANVAQTVGMFQGRMAPNVTNIINPQQGGMPGNVNPGNTNWGGTIW